MYKTFSEFFRLATKEEKEEVWRKVIQEANEEQQAILNQQADE